MTRLSIELSSGHRSRKSIEGIAASLQALQADVQSTWTEWRRLNDEAQELVNEMTETEEAEFVRQSLPRLAAYEPLIEAVVEKAQELSDRKSDLEQALNFLYEELIKQTSIIDDLTSDVTAYGDQVGISVEVDYFTDLLEDPSTVEDA